LLLSAVRAGDIDRRRRASDTQQQQATVTQHGAAARRSAANAGSVMLTAMLRRLNIDLLRTVLMLSSGLRVIKIWFKLIVAVSASV